MLLSILNFPLPVWGLMLIHRLDGQFLSCLGYEMTGPWKSMCLSFSNIPGGSYLCSTSSMESARNLMTWLPRSTFRFLFFFCFLLSSSCFKRIRMSVSLVFIFICFCDKCDTPLFEMVFFYEYILK